MTPGNAATLPKYVLSFLDGIEKLISGSGHARPVRLHCGG